MSTPFSPTENPVPSGAVRSYNGSLWTALTTIPVNLPPLGIGDGSAADQALLVSRAKGFAHWVTGGQGKTVFTVTNANDSGAGSLRAAVVSAVAAGGGWIIFSKTFNVVGGIATYNITLTSDWLWLAVQNVTIDARGVSLTINPGGAPGGIGVGTVPFVWAIGGTDYSDWTSNSITQPCSNLMFTNIQIATNAGGESNNTGTHDIMTHRMWTRGVFWEFSGFTNPDPNTDGLCDVSGGSQDVHFSFCNFFRHHKMSLWWSNSVVGSTGNMPPGLSVSSPGPYEIGSTDHDGSTTGAILRASADHCHWEEAGNRAPEVRSPGAKAHVWNSWIHNWGSVSAGTPPFPCYTGPQGSTTQVQVPNTNAASQSHDYDSAATGTVRAQLVLENNIYTPGAGASSGALLAVKSSSYGADAGNSRSSGLLLEGGATANSNNPASVFDPTGYYSYSLDTADATLKSRILAGAKPNNGLWAYSGPDTGSIDPPNAGPMFVNGVGSTSSVISYPTTTHPGAELFLFVAAIVGTPQVTNPSGDGWTQVHNASSTGGTLAPNIYVGRKTATGSEGGGTVTVTHGSGKCFGIIVELNGVDTTTPLDVAVSPEDSSAGGTNQDCVIPGVTTVTGGCTLITFAADNSSGGHTATEPTGFTELADGGGTVSAEVAYLQGAPAGATGSETVHFSGSGRQVGVLLALRPAATTLKTAADTGSGAGSTSSVVTQGKAGADTGSGAEAASVTELTETPAPSPTVGLDDPRKLYQLYLLDASRNIVGLVQWWLTLTVALNFNDVSSFTFTAPAEALGALVPGGGVLLKRNNQPLIHGPITAIIDQRDVGNPNGLITVGGRSDEIGLSDRVCYPDPTLAFASQTSGAKDTQTAVKGETLIKHFVNLNAGPGAIAARRTSGWTVEADAAAGTAQTVSAQFDNLLTLIQPIAAHDALGFRVALDPASTTGRIFQVFAPVDRSATVRFALKLGNVGSITDEQDAPAATRELFGGGTASGTKAFAETGDTGSEASWGRRIEKYQSNPDSTSTTVLAQNGAAALVVDGASQQITFAPFDTANALFGRDYNMGDKITAVTDSGEVADVLRAATFDFQGSGPEALTLAIGPDGTTTIPAGYQAIRRLEASIRNIATRR